MSLSLDDVKRIALLARIAVSDTEVVDARDQLNSIFGLIEQLRAANTDGIAPMSHAQDVFQRLRPDEVTETDRHAAYQKAAQQVEADLYLVPKVIE